LLDSVSEYAGSRIRAVGLEAHFWRYGLVDTPVSASADAECLWDDDLQLGVCGDSVVASAVDQVARSGAALAQMVSEGLRPQRLSPTPEAISALTARACQRLEAQPS
jgi:hypothetical protein